MNQFVLQLKQDDAELVLGCLMDAIDTLRNDANKSSRLASYGINAQADKTKEVYLDIKRQLGRA